MQTTCQIIDGKLVENATGTCPILVFVKPDEGDKRRLVDEFRIDEHTLNSALDPDELARVEFEPDHAAMILKLPKNYSARDQLLFKVTSIGMFLFRDRLIIVQSEELPLFEGKQFLRVKSIPEILLKLINRAIYHFVEHVKVINRMSDELEQKVNLAMENKSLLQMFRLEKSLVYYLNSINSNGALLEKLKLNAQRLGFSPEEHELLDDVTIENTQCCRQAEISSNILASLMDARASIVSNNLNVLIKTLNIITIGIMVPTLVVSIFSMNVPMPFGLGEHPQAFVIVMSAAIVSVVTLFIIWRMKRL